MVLQADQQQSHQRTVIQDPSDPTVNLVSIRKIIQLEKNLPVNAQIPQIQ